MSGLSLSGSGLTITGGAGDGGVTIGTTTITGGTTGRLLYDNAGVVSEALVTVVSATRLQLGVADNASPTERTLSFEGATAGATDAGVYGALRAPATTGAAAQSGLVLQVPVTGSSGTSANAFIDALHITSRGPFGIPLNNGGFMIGDSLGGFAGTGDQNSVTMFISNRPVLGASPFLCGGGGVSTAALGFFASNYSITGIQYPTAFLRYGGAANTVTWGDVDAAAPAAQVQSVQNVSDGTTDTAGANWTMQGSRGTGTGAGGNINLQVALPGATGTTQNALATMASVNGSTGLLDLTKGTTIAPAAAPATPASGWVLYVDSGDGNKLKAKASTGTVVTLGTP